MYVSVYECVCVCVCVCVCYLSTCITSTGLPWWLVVKNPHANTGNMGSIPGSGKIPWRRKWQSTPVFLPGKFYVQRSLAGDSPGGHRSARCTLETKQQQHRYK